MKARDGASAKSVKSAASGYVQTFKLRTFSVGMVREPAIFPRGRSMNYSEEAAAVARAVFATLDADKEHLVLFALNQKNRINGFKAISTGSLTSSLAHPREVWRAAVNLAAARVVLAHNHPSGNPTPSPEDIDLTQRLKKSGELMEIGLLDHIILGDGKYFSFSDKGVLS